MRKKSGFGEERTDEVKSRARVTANVANNKVDAVRGATNVSVQRARPDLSVGGELVSGLRAHEAVSMFIECRITRSHSRPQW